MAKRKTGSALVRYISAPRQSAPIIRVSAPRAAPAKKHNRRRHGSGALSLTSNRMFEFAIGGAAYGFITKQFGDKLPTLPVLGRTGTIALAAYWFAKNKGGGLAKDVAIAAACIAGYQIGTTGTISGEFDGEVTPQITGIASQV